MTGLGLVDYTMRGNLIDLIVTEVGRSVGGKEMPRERSYATGVRGSKAAVKEILWVKIYELISIQYHTSNSAVTKVQR